MSVQNRTDLTQSLVDSEGFPRSDIDVHAIRTARHKIICETFFVCDQVMDGCDSVSLSLSGLHNDRKALMRVIEEKMFALHSDQSNESEQMRRLKISLPGQSEIEEIGPVVIAAADRQTFVKVGDVTQQSPAAESVSWGYRSKIKVSCLNFHLIYRDCKKTTKLFSLEVSQKLTTKTCNNYAA